MKCTNPDSNWEDFLRREAFYPIRLLVHIADTLEFNQFFQVTFYRVHTLMVYR